MRCLSQPRPTSAAAASRCEPAEGAFPARAMCFAESSCKCSIRREGHGTAARPNRRPARCPERSGCRRQHLVAMSIRAASVGRDGKVAMRASLLAVSSLSRGQSARDRPARRRLTWHKPSIPPIPTWRAPPGRRPNSPTRTMSRRLPASSTIGPILRSTSFGRTSMWEMMKDGPGLMFGIGPGAP